MRHQRLLRFWGECYTAASNGCMRTRTVTATAHGHRLGVACATAGCAGMGMEAHASSLSGRVAFVVLGAVLGREDAQRVEMNAQPV